MRGRQQRPAQLHRDRLPAHRRRAVHGRRAAARVRVGPRADRPRDFYETTCTNPPGVDDQTKFVTAAGCGTFGITNSGPPNFITSDCRKPAGLNNQTAFADPRTCFADPGTAFPFLKVTCTPVQTMPPTVVDPSLDCTTFGVTYAGTPDFTVTHCDKRTYVPTVPVAACVAVNSGPPDFVVTTCGLVSTDTPVASCVLGPLPPNGVNTVTCVKPAGPTNAGPTERRQLRPAVAAGGPELVEVLCSGPNTVSSGPVDPALCSDSVGPPPNVYVTTCTTAPIGPYLVATPVAGACVTATDPTTFVTTTCSTPPGPNNMPATNSAPCTLGPSTDGNQVTTTCSVSDVTDFVPTASCTDVTQVGNGPAISCSTVTTLAEAGNCTPGAVQATSPFDTTIACHNTVTSPMADYAGTCVAGPGTGAGETITCNLKPIDVLVADSGCTAGTSAGGLLTQCDTLPSGTGHTYTMVTTKTVTTTPFSGPVPSGPDVVVTTSTAPVPVGNACYPIAQTTPSLPDFPAKPAVDIANCSAWPCQATPSPGTPGSENSLADVSQYYYKNDLRPLMADNVPKKGLGVEDDNAKHQHMTTFALALGVSGTLNFRSDYRSLSTVVGDFAAIRAGTKDWPVWPDPLLTYASPGDYNNPKSIDDYWHTAVNGRGKFFNANDATSAAQGLRDALASTDNQAGSLGLGRRNLDSAAERDRQLHLLDQVPVVDLARRRRGAVDRPELGRRSEPRSGRRAICSTSARSRTATTARSSSCAASIRSASSPGRPTSVRAARPPGRWSPTSTPARWRSSMPPTSACSASTRT